MSSLFSRRPKKENTVTPKRPKSRKKVVWSLIVTIVLVAAGGVAYWKLRPAQTSTSQTSTLQTATARQGNLTLLASGTGTMMATNDSYIGFTSGGKITNLYAKVGDNVKEGDLLGEVDDSSAQLKLAEAKQALLELTSPEAIANAKLDITTAQATVVNAKIALNNQQYWKNDALIQDQYANLVMAKANLDRAQEAYDKANVGEYINTISEAVLYQALYNAQQQYNTAELYYSLYSQKPTQRQLDAAQATLDLANATLTNAQNYLAALTGGDVPDNATGTALDKLNQVKLAAKEAEEALAATKLYAPFSGTIMEVDAKAGDTVGSGSVFRIADLSQLKVQFYMDESDWSKIKVGYKTDVTFDALPDQTFTGVVTQVLPALVSTQGASMVEGVLALDQSYDEIQLPIGVSGAVDVISASAENAVLVPVEALHAISTGKYAVFVVENGTPKMRSVEVGIQDDTYAEIKSGLKAGEVVTTGIVETGK